MQTNADAREGQPGEPAGEPAMRAGRPDWSSPALERFEPPQRPGVSKAVFGLILAGAALTAIGVVWTMKPAPAPASAAPRAPSAGFLGEYVQQGRQGVDMARDVQALRREHMEGVQRAIEGDLSEHMPGRKP